MPDDIRVLIVDLSKKYGGSSVRALTLAEHLKPWTIAIAGLENSGVVKAAKQRNTSVRIVGKSRVDPTIPIRLTHAIRNEHFQIIDTQNIPSKFWSYFAALLTDVAFVSTLNSSYKDEFGTALRGYLYTLLDRWTNFNVDRYIAVSKAIRSNLLKDGISESKVDLITNGIDISDSLLSSNRDLIRNEIGIPQDAILCVSVGRLVWAKGYEDFIEAFARVASQVQNAYAVIVGGGILHSSLTEKIRHAGLENRIKLLGQCDVRTTWDVMKASDVFVLSSRSEGVPYALLEAAAIGLPIVSTRCGGIPEILTEDLDALLVPVGEPDAIASALLKLCQDRALAQRLAVSANAKIKTEYSLSAQITAIRQAYEKAINDKQQKLNRRVSVAWRS